MEGIKIGQRRFCKDADDWYEVVSEPLPGRFHIKWNDKSEGIWKWEDLIDDRLILGPNKSDQPLGQRASAWLRSVADMLEQKAVQYGDSAGQPVRMFSSSDMIEQLKVRADDKLSRLTRGTSGGEDAVKDLVGYIALLAAAGWSGNGK